jgi:hypothetical protein
MPLLPELLHDHVSLDLGYGKTCPTGAMSANCGALVNQCLLDTERVSQDCLSSPESFGRVSEPATAETNQRAPGLVFGQPQVIALPVGLSHFLSAVNGVHYASLRETVQALSNIAPEEQTASQMSLNLS